MRSETISIHGGFDCDPATKAVAPPIYQTVAYEFDSADHGAAFGRPHRCAVVSGRSQMLL